MNRKIIAFLLIITMFLIAGCEPTVPATPNGTHNTESKTTETVAGSEKKVSEVKADNFIIYTFSNDGTTLVAQNIPANKLTAVDNVHILNYLLKNDQLFDKNAQVKSVEIKDNIAKVNFNNDFKKIKVGGSNNELLIIAAIVNTLMDNDSHIKKVQILVEGKIIETLLGHVDIADPLDKMPELIKK